MQSATASVPQVFNNAAIPYAAFNLRDPYYREMAELVLNEVRQVSAQMGLTHHSCMDLGAGIGISTLVLSKYFARMTAVEPEESMRYVCGLNFFCNPRVSVVEGRAENLSTVTDGPYDVVTSCQMFHLLKDVADGALEEIRRVLYPGGIFAFDLGPSNWEFAISLADHRSGQEPALSEIMTELAHPFYRIAHAEVYAAVVKRYPDFGRERENLWPPVAKRTNRAELEKLLSDHRFSLIRVSEFLVPISGMRVIDFIRNGWSVFFRWPPLDKLSMDEKIAFMEDAVKAIYADPRFEELASVVSYHPSAVITAIRR